MSDTLIAGLLSSIATILAPIIVLIIHGPAIPAAKQINMLELLYFV